MPSTYSKKKRDEFEFFFHCQSSLGLNQDKAVKFMTVKNKAYGFTQLMQYVDFNRNYFKLMTKHNALMYHMSTVK